MTTPALMFSVTGTPRPLPRPRFVRGRRMPVSIADPKAKLWKLAVERAVDEMMRNSGLPGWISGPVRVDMVFCMPTPQADRWGQPHTAKPDLDNVAKMVCDCMERAGALPRGDSRVSMGEMSKVWAERGGVYVTMRPATTSRPMPTTAPAPSWLASDTA